MLEINYKERYDRLVAKIAEIYNEAADVRTGKAEANEFFHPDYYIGICSACADLRPIIREFEQEDKDYKEINDMLTQLNRKVNTVNFILNNMKKDSEE